MSAKIFILDTNVLIEDPNAIEILRNGEENKIFIPYSVIVELDRLKSNINKSHLVHVVIDKLVNDKKLIIIKRSDFNYLKDECHDESIIDDIKSFVSQFNNDEEILNQCFFVSNDQILRFRVYIEVNLQTQEYKHTQPFKSDVEIYTGVVKDSADIISNCFTFNDGKLWFERINDVITWQNEVWKIKPRTTYQNMLMQLLLDNGIDVVTVGGFAGCGKTLISLAAALQLVQQKKPIKKLKITDDSASRKNKKKNINNDIDGNIDTDADVNVVSRYKKIYIVRPTVIIGNELGFLPGDLAEKLDPYFRPIRELLLKLHECRPCKRLFIGGDPKNGLDSDIVEFIPMTYLRGMNIENAIVIVDECQNLSRIECRTLLSRMGENVRCFLTGDTTQIDNKYLNASNNGLNWIVRKFKGEKNYGHITLKGPKSRGPIADLVLKTEL